MKKILVLYLGLILICQGIAFSAEKESLTFGNKNQTLQFSPDQTGRLGSVANPRGGLDGEIRRLKIPVIEAEIFSRVVLDTVSDRIMPIRGKNRLDDFSFSVHFQPEEWGMVGSRLAGIDG